MINQRDWAPRAQESHCKFQLKFKIIFLTKEIKSASFRINLLYHTILQNTKL
jgi:hypothetical protein